MDSVKNSKKKERKFSLIFPNQTRVIQIHELSILALKVLTFDYFAICET